MNDSLESLKEAVFELVRCLAGPNQRGSFTESTLILEENILDSFGLIQLVASIDAEFSITVKTEDLLPENFASVLHIAELVKSYL